MNVAIGDNGLTEVYERYAAELVKLVKWGFDNRGLGFVDIYDVMGYPQLDAKARAFVAQEVANAYNQEDGYSAELKKTTGYQGSTILKVEYTPKKITIKL